MWVKKKYNHSHYCFSGGEWRRGGGCCKAGTGAGGNRGGVQRYSHPRLLWSDAQGGLFFPLYWLARKYRQSEKGTRRKSSDVFLVNLNSLTKLCVVVVVGYICMVTRDPAEPSSTNRHGPRDPCSGVRLVWSSLVWWWGRSTAMMAPLPAPSFKTFQVSWLAPQHNTKQHSSLQGG